MRRAKAMLTYHRLHFVLLAVTALIFAAAGLEIAFERHAESSTIHNYGDALWWAIVTVTTVGYGCSPLHNNRIEAPNEARWPSRTC